MGVQTKLLVFAFEPFSPQMMQFVSKPCLFPLTYKLVTAEHTGVRRRRRESVRWLLYETDGRGYVRIYFKKEKLQRKSHYKDTSSSWSSLVSEEQNPAQTRTRKDGNKCEIEFNE